MVDIQQDSVRRRRIIKSAALGVGGTLLAGCTGSGDGGGGGDGSDGGDGGGGTESSGGSTGTPGGSSEPITIGGLLQLSGIYAEYGKPFRDGMQFAIQQINDDGGIMGRQLQMVSADNGDDPKTAVSNFLKFIDQNDIVAAAGPAGVQVDTQVAKTAEEQQIPVYFLAANYPIYTKGQDSRYVFNPGLVSIKNWIHPQGSWAKQEGLKKVGVIYQNELFKGLVGWAIDHYFPDDIELHERTAPPNATDYTSYLRQMPKDLDFFVGTGHPAHVYDIYTNMYQLGFDPKVFAGGINPMQASYESIPDSIDRSFAPFSVIDMTTDKYAQVASAFADSTGDYFDSTTAQGWTCVKLIAESIKQAGSADPTDIADQTRDGTFDLLNAAPIQFQPWGALDQWQEVFYKFHPGSSPDFYPDAEFTLEAWYTSEKLPGMTPSEAGDMG